MRPALVLLGLAMCAGAADRFPFEVSEPAEVVATIELQSPGADWAVPGREAAVGNVSLDGAFNQHVMLYGGAVRTAYRVFLGPVQPGRHEIVVERNAQYSAPGAGFETGKISFEQFGPKSELHSVIAHAPVLYARQNTIGRFSDIPLIVYCERKPGGLQYTVIFSNEDGGTSTRALMARWGRTTDIEYVYDLRLGSGGSPDTAIVQGPGHKDLQFQGRYQAAHPLLMPVTDNNMIAEASNSPLRFQIAPVLVNLSDASRESVMDRNPVTYTVMAKELERERKLRRFGVVEGEKISDQRNYLFVDYRASHRQSRFNVQVLLKDGRAFSSDLGRFDYAIGPVERQSAVDGRNEPVRTTVELPPGTKGSDIDRLAWTCLAAESDKQLSHDGLCRLEKVNRVFFLDHDGRPGKDVFHSREPYAVPSGQSVVLRP